MDRIIEDYLRAVASRLRLPRQQKDAAIAELRGSIHAQTDEIAAREGLPRDAAAKRVLGQMGAPGELAIAYNGSSVEVRSSTGEILLRATRAVGRGTVAALKWGAIAVAFLLVLGSVVAYVAYQETKPYIEREYRQGIYQGELDCPNTSRCTSAPIEDSFGAPVDAHSLEARLLVDVLAAGGSLRVVVVNPDGELVLDRTFTGGTQAERHEVNLKWAADAGNWKVSVTPTGFGGKYDLSVLSVGIQTDSL